MHPYLPYFHEQEGSRDRGCILILLLKLGGSNEIGAPQEFQSSRTVEEAGRSKCFSSLSGVRPEDTYPEAPCSNQQMLKLVPLERSWP